MKQPVFLEQEHVDLVRGIQSDGDYTPGHAVDELRILCDMTANEALQTVLYLEENPDVVTVEECTSCKGTA